ncbi:MAG: aa3-type cytochrome c oxidase subunit IV [Marinosulfonomonas sp.]|nr:aa3-type cytochrome c oxidase subunit IV [Marinosulfonomonas sp.]
MAKHEHGSMDISAHEKTFSGFNKAITWSSIFIIVFLIFLAIVGG